MLVAAGASAQPPNSARGKPLYNDKYRCYACHGFSGQNGPGARLVPMKLTQAAFIALVRHPRDPHPGFSPSGQQDRMPAYSAKVLPDADLADVYAYIKTLPESPAAQDIPLLDQIKRQKE